MNLKNSLFTVLLVGAGVFLAISCSKDKAEEPSECYPGTFQISYQDHIVPILNKSCRSATGCHATGASPQPAYTDYNALKAKVTDGTLENRILVARDMPALWGPDSVEITDCEREMFKLWIEAGAPNN